MTDRSVPSPILIVSCAKAVFSHAATSLITHCSFAAIEKEEKRRIHQKRPIIQHRASCASCEKGASFACVLCQLFLSRALPAALVVVAKCFVAFENLAFRTRSFKLRQWRAPVVRQKTKTLTSFLCQRRRKKHILRIACRCENAQQRRVSPQFV